MVFGFEGLVWYKPQTTLLNPYQANNKPPFLTLITLKNEKGLYWGLLPQGKLAKGDYNMIKNNCYLCLTDRLTVELMPKDEVWS